MISGHIRLLCHCTVRFYSAVLQNLPALRTQQQQQQQQGAEPHSPAGLVLLLGEGRAAGKLGKTLSGCLGKEPAMPQQIPLSCSKISGTVLLAAWNWKKARRGHLLHACLLLPFPISDTRRWRRAGAVGQPSGWSGGASCQGHAYGGLVGESIVSCAASRVSVDARQRRVYTSGR